MADELIANRYKPLFNRARGGFSNVVIAWDSRLARRVAIKRINTGTSLPVASLEEARTAALLTSPNIVSVYDFEHTLAETLIIMENVDGPSLAELMVDSEELLDIDVVTTILDGVVSALEYAHENQILHLDIKPANILIDQSGHIKVSDFGLAELAGSNGFGEVQGGTIGYMPPEQLTGKLVDVRTDIWALASLSYQLLTGANPFFALSPRESLERIIAGHYELPSELRPSLSGGVDEALVKALSPQMEGRPSTVTQFWLELRPHLGKLAPGRRRLKALASIWAGKEAALTEGSDTDAPQIGTDYSDKTKPLDEEVAQDQKAQKDGHIAIWNGNYESEDAACDEEDWQEDSSKEGQHKAGKENADLKDKQRIPLWQRLSPKAQEFVAHAICALAAASMAWFAMSALPYLSDPLAQAATAAATNTGNPTPALLDAAFAVRLIIVLVVGAASFIAPRVGAALAVLSLVLGFFFTGNWLIGMIVLAECIGWWVAVGRRNFTDSTVFTLGPLLAVISLPMLFPLLAGYFQSWRRALGTAAIGCFVCSLLSLVTTGLIDTLLSTVLGIGEPSVYGRFGEAPLQDLLSASPTLMQMTSINDLFIPLISLLTSGEFWIIFVSWLGASVVMSLLIGGKSRVKYILATLCGTSIVAAGYVVSYFVFAGEGSWALLAAIIVRLIIALAACLVLIAFGVQPRPYAFRNRVRGNAR